MAAFKLILAFGALAYVGMAAAQEDKNKKDTLYDDSSYYLGKYDKISGVQVAPIFHTGVTPYHSAAGIVPYHRAAGILPYHTAAGIVPYRSAGIHALPYPYNSMPIAKTYVY